MKIINLVCLLFIVCKNNSGIHNKAKHIQIKYHFVEDLVNDDIIELKYCSTNLMIADILTKGLPTVKFEYFRNMLGICSL